ncbi:MAG: hypothetical protein U0234_30195 [Sandaracinus sp.]
MDRLISTRTSLVTLGLGALVALSGCPGPATTTHTDTGTPGNDAGMTGNDAGHDAGTPGNDTGMTGNDTGTPGNDTGMTGNDTGMPGNDAATVGNDTGPMTAIWDVCAEAVVFGQDGEGCSFTGSCLECVLTPSPRTALCMSGGHLRVQAAGAGACATTPDAGTTTFPDTGVAPRDAGAGADGGQCSPLSIAAPTAPACSQAVVNCIQGGGDLSTCVSAEPACLSCAQQDIQSCATTTGGCDDEAGLALCCFQANCPDQSCTTTTCQTPWNNYVSCVGATTCSLSDACFPAAPTCPARIWTAPTAVSCTTATLTCINNLPATATGDDVQACLDADTTAPAGTCGTCWSDGLISCVTDAGQCTQELGDVVCCLDNACPAGSAANCQDMALSTGGACVTLWNGFFDCVGTALNSPSLDCNSHLGVCFP